jgi:hypothetical protein
LNQNYNSATAVPFGSFPFVGSITLSPSPGEKCYYPID